MANALKRRGSLTIWSDPAMTWEAGPTGRRGRQPDHGGSEDQKTVRVREPDWMVPNFSTLSRREKTLKVKIPFRGSAGPLHLLIDSTGIKVEGEGEWS
jgi:hypothetical protein